MTGISRFLHKNDFLVRRLHSISGVVPIGAYMIVHLVTNSTIANSVTTFQMLVNNIHSLPFLWVIEWSFIFLPIIFHAAVGVWITRTGRNNSSNYPTSANRRYVWQRWTGMLAAIFIFTHVFHLHGWFHFEWWLENVAHPLGMANFKAYSASSTLARALTWPWVAFYVVGVVACAYHLANGIWTAGITWGVWLTPKAQRRASLVCKVGGVLIGAAGLAAIGGAKSVDIDAAHARETEMYEYNVKDGKIVANPEKRWHEDEKEEETPELPAREVGFVNPTSEKSDNM